MKESGTYCALLRKHVCMSAQGTLKPCCRFQTEMATPIVFDPSEPSRGLNAPELRSLRQDLLEGRRNPGCRKCHDQEKSGGYSYRNWSIDQFGDQFGDQLGDARSSRTEIDVEEIEYVEFSFGNQCNLKCRMCSSSNSTLWRSDEEALVGFGIGRAPPVNIPLGNLEPFLPRLRMLKILGGEPLLYKDHLRLLELIEERGKLSELVIEYCTNGTIMPSEPVIELWSKARRIDLNISVDGIGAVNDYIRSPSKWEVIEANVRSYLALRADLPRLECRVACAANAYNYEVLPALVDWWKDVSGFPGRGLFRPLITPVIYPPYLSAKVLPPAYKSEIARRLSEYPNYDFKPLVDFMTAEDHADLWPRFVSFTGQLDRLRGESISESIPGLARYL